MKTDPLCGLTTNNNRQILKDLFLLLNVYWMYWCMFFTHFKTLHKKVHLLHHASSIMFWTPILLLIKVLLSLSSIIDFTCIHTCRQSSKSNQQHRIHLTNFEAKTWYSAAEISTVQWNPSYNLFKITKKSRGSNVILHLKQGCSRSGVYLLGIRLVEAWGKVSEKAVIPLTL